jgi:hypothetical protein
MKNLLKWVVLLVFFAHASTSLSAQDDDKRRGFRMGYLNSDISNSSGDLFKDNSNSFYGGVFYETDLTRFFRFTTGLEYVQIGSSMDEDNKVRVSFLTLPVSAKFRFAGLFARAGVNGMLRVGSSETLNGQQPDPKTLEYDRLAVNTFFGLGVKLAFIEFEFRYHKGVSDVVKSFSSDYYQLGINLFI